jgi:hypothetical protein
MDQNLAKPTCPEGPRQGVTVKVATVRLVAQVLPPVVRAGARVRVRPAN